MTRLASLSTAALIALAAHAGLAGQAWADQELPEVLDIVGYPAGEGERPAGMYMVIPSEYAGMPEDATPAPVLGAAKFLFYMNRNGGTFVPGLNDSRTNRSSVPTQTSQIRPWAIDNASWAQVMECVRGQFALYDVEVTDIDPGNLPHIESVVAGQPQDLQLPPGVGGVSPFREDCGTIDNSIVFTFAEVFGNDLPLICDVVAQEIAHSFGLDHELLASDPMTYLPFNGQRAFQNVNAQCGEDVPRVCFCGQQTQNSVTMLSQRIGLKSPGGDAVAPTLSFVSPVNGAVVRPGFEVTVTASDNVAITRVELVIDGVQVATLTQAPFSFFAPANLSNGTHIVETRAFDTENSVTQQISVIVDPNAPDQINPDGPSVLTGGCSAGGTSGAAGGLLALLALGLVAIRRRA